MRMKAAALSTPIGLGLCLPTNCTRKGVSQDLHKVPKIIIYALKSN